MSLQLRYAFIPTPYPIRASVGGADPNTVDVQVTVSPPGLAVTLSAIRITIPVGDDTLAGDLSGASSLPQPVDVSGAQGWSLSVSGSDVILLGGNDGTTLSGALVFTLPQVAVNETTGTVQIVITETPLSGSKVMDNTTYTLFKQEANYPISSFRADPPALNNLDQSVMLYWTCTDQGRDLDYSLSSDGGWAPRNCLNGGQCFGCADGAAGVQSPLLAQGTTFSLDVIGTDNGDPVVLSTLRIDVPVLVPQISQNTYVEQLTVGGGALLRIHWLATNAAACTVRLNNDTVLGQGPADTYDDGWLVALPGPGTYSVSLVAHASQGKATATQQLGDFQVSAGYTLPLTVPLSTVAITPDSSTAWAAGGQQDMGAYFWPVTLSNGQVGTPVFTEFQIPPLLSPDASYAAQLITSLSTLLVFPLSAVSSITGASVDAVCGAFAPDTRSLLLGCGDGTVALTPVPVPYDSVPEKVTVDGVPVAVAVSAPAGGAALALASIPAYGVAFLGLKPFVSYLTVPLPAPPGALAAAPDGSIAVVALPAASAVAVMDLVDFAVEPNTIGVGASPSAVAFSPDGTLAFVANHGDGTVSVIDVPNRRAVGAFGVPAGPVALAVSADGNHLAVACDTSQSVRML